MTKWIYYNYAMLPNVPPHGDVDATAVTDGSVWRGNKAVLARWITDFDCGYETDWWYVIKDSEYEIDTLKAKRRYEITKGRRNFEIKKIEFGSCENADAIFDIRKAYYDKYQAADSVKDTKEAFRERFKGWHGVVLGAFCKNENGELSDALCGYAHLKINGRCIEFLAQKVNPEYEARGINAALVDGVLNYFAENIRDGSYICDGAKNIHHKTAFQDYLEKYFGFRKAYCKLRIAYRPTVAWLIPILYLFRTPLKKLDGIDIVHLVNSVLTLEEIKRKCDKTDKKRIPE